MGQDLAALAAVVLAVAYLAVRTLRRRRAPSCGCAPAVDRSGRGVRSNRLRVLS